MRRVPIGQLSQEWVNRAGERLTVLSTAIADRQKIHSCCRPQLGSGTVDVKWFEEDLSSTNLVDEIDHLAQAGEVFALEAHQETGQVKCAGIVGFFG